MKKLSKIICSSIFAGVTIMSGGLLAACGENSADELTKAQYSEAFNATSEVMSSENTQSHANYVSAEEIGDYEELTGSQLDLAVLQFKNMAILSKGIFDNENFQQTDNIISFEVKDFAGAENISFKMNYGSQDDKIFINYLMIMPNLEEVEVYQSYHIELDYDFDTKIVNSYNAEMCMVSGDALNTVTGYENIIYTKEEGTKGLIRNTEIFNKKAEEFKTLSNELLNKDFEDTRYDFTEEFKLANENIAH